MRGSLLILTFALAVAAGCGDRDGGGKPFPSAEVLMEADRAFARASARRGADAWSEVWAERGLLYGDGSEPVVGPSAVSRRIAKAEPPRREPTDSGMLWPGTLGYTVGNWWPDPDATGDGTEQRRYLTMWQRIDGAWKVVLDLALPEQQTSSAARAFDFWLGDWKLEQRIWSGRRNDFEPYGAENSVRLIEDGGVLVESFEGQARFFWLGMEEPAPMRGTSVRVYYPEEREWRIFWMDSLDPKFGPPYTGSFSGDVGEFLLTERPAGIPPSRIRFERQIDGSVDWQLALRTPDGERWQPLWLIEFRRDEES